jgi:hypothetical protein
MNSPELSSGATAEKRPVFGGPFAPNSPQRQVGGTWVRPSHPVSMPAHRKVLKARRLHVSQDEPGLPIFGQARLGRKWERVGQAGTRWWILAADTGFSRPASKEVEWQK